MPDITVIAPVVDEYAKPFGQYDNHRASRLFGDQILADLKKTAELGKIPLPGDLTVSATQAVSHNGSPPTEVRVQIRWEDGASPASENVSRVISLAPLLLTQKKGTIAELYSDEGRGRPGSQPVR